MSDLADAHQAIRAAHGPGRVEYLFDRQRALALDLAEGVGTVALNPEVAVGYEHVGGEVVERDGKRYRVQIVEQLRGVRDARGRITWGYWVDAQPIAPIAPMPMPRHDILNAIEMRCRVRLRGPGPSRG